MSHSEHGRRWTQGDVDLLDVARGCGRVAGAEVPASTSAINWDLRVIPAAWKQAKRYASTVAGVGELGERDIAEAWMDGFNNGDDGFDEAERRADLYHDRIDRE